LEQILMRELNPGWSLNLERALRWAAVAHDGQVRKSSTVPYIEHPMAVAMILDRLGFPEEVVIAGLLHDVVEDTDATLEAVRERFGEEVAAIVEGCTEVKVDSRGRKRDWNSRKQDHITALAAAPVPTRAVALADKLHNLLSIALDLEEGREVWARFNAGRGSVLAYYRANLVALGWGDPRLEMLAEQGVALLERVKPFAEMPTGKG
jgi:guanosine-3',5'-bis(diphosphate) 3'-pyrophosphohydrolase